MNTSISQWVLLVVMAATSATSLMAQASGDQQPKPAEQKRRAVSWVNSKLPNGPGLTHYVLDSKALGHPVGYVVWTPRGYEENLDQRFPVIYFLHGAGGNEAADSAGFSGCVAKAVERGLLPPVLCVFPNGGMSGYRGDVETMIIEELIPHIDKQFRTRAAPGSRAIAGFSMGGAGSVYLTMMHPETFCAAGSMGGSFRGGQEQLTAIDKSLPEWKRSGFGLFVANGDKDRPEAFESLAAKLKTENVDCERLVIPDTNHSLGLYYERSAEKLLSFLGKHIQK